MTAATTPAATTPAAIVIPAASVGPKMKGHGAKSLISLPNEETVLGRQLRLLRKRWPDTPIYVGIGFEGEKLRGRFRAARLHWVDCPEHEKTGVAETVRLALAQAPPGPVLVVFGDLVFGQEAIGAMTVDCHNRLWGESGLSRRAEVGLTVDEYGLVGHLSHGLEIRWAQVALLQDEARHLLAQAAHIPSFPRWFFYEALNHLIDSLPFFFEPLGDWLVEIDQSKDIGVARMAIRMSEGVGR